MVNAPDLIVPQTPAKLRFMKLISQDLHSEPGTLTNMQLTNQMLSYFDNVCGI